MVNSVPQDIPILMKPSTQSTSWRLGWSLAMTLWCYLTIHFLTWPQTQHKGQHQMPSGDNVGLDREGGYWKTQRLAIEQCHDKQAREPSVSCLKLSVTTSLLTSGRITSQITIPLIVMGEVQLSERTTKLCATLKMKWSQE